MNAAAPAERRAQFIDALRALALLGVFVVNALSFVHLWASGATGIPEPIDSTAAWATHVAVATLLQAKGYPLLAFLVGYSWGIALRGARRRGESPACTRRRRAGRMVRQLGLGLAHGFLVYFGDILAPLALLGLWLLLWSGLRTRALLARAQDWALLWIALNLPLALLAFGVDAAAPWPPHGLTHAATWAEVVALQAQGYLWYLAALYLFLPMLAAFGALGMAAARLRWLEHRRWARGWRSLALVLVPLGLALNFGHALWVTPFGEDAVIDPGRQDALMQFLGPLLAAGLVAMLASAWHAGRARWLARLAPAGRMTLSLYVAAHLVYLPLLAGPGLALAPVLGSLGLALLGAGWWLVALAIGSWWTPRYGAGPLERLLGSTRRAGGDDPSGGAAGGFSDPDSRASVPRR